MKAQIKLRFRTATSQPVVVIRTFQVCNTSTLDATSKLGHFPNLGRHPQRLPVNSPLPQTLLHALLCTCSSHKRRLLCNSRRSTRRSRPSTGRQARSKLCRTDVLTSTALCHHSWGCPRCGVFVETLQILIEPSYQVCCHSTGYPGECHLCTPGRQQLAVVRWTDPEEEV